MKSETLTVKGHIFLKGITACLPVDLALFALHWNCTSLAVKKVSKNIYSPKSVFKPVL